MSNKLSLFFVLTIVMLLFLNCSSSKSTSPYISQNMPTVEREFRAAWIASVANINWPSKPGLSSEEQKNEVIVLLNVLQKNNLNAAVIQIRPQGDALYKSNLEPWSYYLTGSQGKAPEPYYDPLEFWIEQAHLRGIELHAWLNPYRAHHVSGGPVTDASIVKKHANLAVHLETGYWWLDPSKQETQDHSYNVVMDIVKRYNIDGIHFDDYFYPYPEYNNNKDFPDDESWNLYTQNGGKLSRADWRRDNVNKFIKRVYKGIKKEKASVKFGISPFGFWRPHYPASVTVGFDQYNALYADAKLWLNKGWVDYYTPQLYWPINRIELSFPVLLNWWNNENYKNRHIWPGMSIGRLKGESAIDETFNQIMITRGMISEAPGQVLWNIKPLITSPELAAAILDGPYKKQALTPKYPWLNKKTPLTPSVNTTVENDTVSVRWNHKNKDEIAHWIVYTKYGTVWSYAIYGSLIESINIPLKITDKKDLAVSKTGGKELIKTLNTIAVSAVDKFGNESESVKIIDLEF
ncbi:family 10 glycosylhydrolase [Lutibacter sp. A80]|uniref:glycoside hydrolase family 10 protein n=1 Tax=Lutibacter sp. A80 TaxID=2918453 RepID=UPI001F06C088|nr:family 10 glycosylhydrolase [Lutibacter sp. A80]UMB62035.1 family 10 glycosylhydrolase [Lutibacter sp. A80]